jgi:hypothetical protein
MKAKTRSTSKHRTAPRTKGKQNKKNAIVLTVLSVGAAGVLGFLCWQYIAKRKKAKNSDLDTLLTTRSNNAASNPSSFTFTPSYIDTPATTDSSTYTAATPTASAKKTVNTSGFPLKKGSKGENVKSLQKALIAKYGAAILPKYGADGDFGSETTAALKKAGLPATIDESTYYTLVQVVNQSIDAAAIAKKLLAGAGNQDFGTTISNLKKMNTPEDYRQVSNIFSQYFLGTVRKTLVNGMLDAFPNGDQHQQIQNELLRMGLKYDGSKWSLSGFDGKAIVTLEATSVWINATESVQVPASTVLGAEVTRRLDYTLFENNDRHFLVASKSVRYL